MGKNREILLSDLGIATIAHKTGGLLKQGLAGTPLYMPAEQSEGRPRTASDQYALGIVAYEWLCGMVPFRSSSVVELAMQHLVSPPPSLCQQIPTLPPAAEQVILKALAKRPQHRFRTITEFASALEEASQTTRMIAGVVEQNQIAASSKTAFQAEPGLLPHSESYEIMAPQHTHPLSLPLQPVGGAQDPISARNTVISHSVTIRDRPSRKPYATPSALRKRRSLSYLAVSLIILVLSISIGFAPYLDSHTSMTLPTASLSPTHRTPTAQQNVLVEDTFRRGDSEGWGRASDGHHQWEVGGAKPFFLMNNFAGWIARGQGALEALIGQPTDNVDVTIIGTVNRFGGKVNLGIVLRWTDSQNWYKALVDGKHLSILRSVNGQVVTLKQIDAQTSEGVPLRLRFRSTFTTVFAKVWSSGTNEPLDWQVTVDDQTFFTGRFGIRVVEQPTTVITITLIRATIASPENDS